MASETKVQANIANAQKSTGPQTPEGKAAVSLNALKHGLRSRRVVLPYESQEEFEELCADFDAQWHPQDLTEIIYVQRMAISLWKLERMETLETQLTERCDVDILSRIWQQQARLERAYDKAKDELERYRKTRTGKPAEPVEEEKPAPIVDPPAPKPAQTEYVMRAATAPVPAQVVAIDSGPPPASL